MVRMATSSTTEQKLRDYRLERYEEMRFTHREATVLANSLGDDGFALDYRKVKKALNAGCGHRTAVRIFENVPDLSTEDDDDDTETPGD
jgi:hypothetical protein